MPQVPYLSQPRVSPNALPGVRRSVNAPIEAFGGGVAAQQIDLSGPANVAGNIAQQNALDRQRIRSEAALEADQVAVTRATAATQNEANDFMNGPNGLLRQRGTNAMTIDQDAYDKYGELVGRIRGQLGNDRQRAVYDKYVQNGWVAIQSQTVPHIAREREALDKESTEASVASAKNAVIQDPLNPVIQEHSVTTVRAVLTERVKRLGLSDEAATNVVNDAVSDIHLSAIQSILSQPNVPNRDRMAAAYFDAHKKELVGKDQLDADRLVKQSLMDGDVLRTTDKIIASTPSETAADAEIDKQIEDPVMRERAKQHLAAVYNRRDGMVRAEQQKAYERGATLMRDHGGDITAIPRTLHEAMGEDRYRVLSNEAWRLTHSRDVGDPEQFNALVNMANFQKAVFNSTDITKIPGLSQQQIHTLQTIQRGTINSDIRQSETDLQRDLTRSLSAESRYRRLLESAAEEDKPFLEDQLIQANRQSTLIQSDLTALKQRARGTPVPPSTPPSGSPPTASAAPLTVPGTPKNERPAPYSPQASGRPLDLTTLGTPLKKPPPAIAVDIATAKALGLTDYLDLARSHGWDVDGVPPLPPEQPAKKKPAVTTTKVNRGPDGKITDTTTTITKPED